MSATKSKSKTSIWLWPALALVVGGGVFAVVAATQGGGASSPTTSDYDQRPQDVTIKSCAVRDGFLKGSVVVTNHTTQSSTYAVKIAFESPSGTIQYDTGTVIVNDLAAGAGSGPQDVQVAKKVGDVAVRCQLAGAARYSS